MRRLRFLSQENQSNEFLIAKRQHRTDLAQVGEAVRLGDGHRDLEFQPAACPCNAEGYRSADSDQQLCPTRVREADRLQSPKPRRPTGRNRSRGVVGQFAAHLSPFRRLLADPDSGPAALLSLSKAPAIIGCRGLVVNGQAASNCNGAKLPLGHVL